jgi:hypothetical protein
MSIISAADAKSATTAGAGAVEIALDMAERRQYRITARGAPLWFAVIPQGGTGAPPGTPSVATIAGDGCHFLATGNWMYVARIKGINNVDRSRISIIRDGGTDATGVLSELAAVQAY